MRRFTIAPDRRRDDRGHPGVAEWRRKIGAQGRRLLRVLQHQRGLQIHVGMETRRQLEVAVHERAGLFVEREHFTFAMQDLLLTLAAFALIGAWEGLRWMSGFGTSFDAFPAQ